jgi:hypothetical protein
MIERNAEMARTDQLTGLFNRHHLATIGADLIPKRDTQSLGAQEDDGGRDEVEDHDVPEGRGIDLGPSRDGRDLGSWCSASGSGWR